MPSLQRKLQHLYLRAGFGESITVINNALNKTISQAAEEIFLNSKNYTGLTSIIQNDFFNSNGTRINLRELTNKDKQKLMQQSRKNIRDLNISWLNKMSADKAQLREKMTLFWHGHFACRTRVALFALNQNNTLRKHALGKFSDLLLEVSKDPGMLQFLNNQQNRKSSPNENFAREVMELFTLGRGNYSENDVKEAARAFTGWGFNIEGEFTFRKRAHDSDEKFFLGKSGNFTGEDIINIILEKKKTAGFITEKIYKYFVNEDVNAEIVKELSEKFYDSGYDIEKLMRSIFMSDWFYEKENIGAKIKSPVELISNMTRSFNIKFHNPMPLIAVQKALGQMLFNPPNVAGWAGGRSWIDTSSLMYRLKLPETIFKSSELDFDYKEEPQEEGENYSEVSKNEKKQYRLMSAEADLTQYINSFSGYEKNELQEKIEQYLLQLNLNKETKAIIKKYSDTSNTENNIESMTLRILSLPEYQMC